MDTTRLIAALLACALPLTAAAQGPERSPAPEDAVLYIISPADGESVRGPVTIRFGLTGMGVAPAGVDRPGTGHHHLLINVDDDELPPMDMPLPSTDRVRHFGGGQTEVTVDLEPGEHTLQLLLGDHRHVPHEPPVISEPIRIRVEE